MQSSASLPNELWDDVLDHLSDDQRTLRSCSLVWRAWTTRSQRHLFASLTLTHPRHIHLLDTIVRSNPRLGQAVLSVTVFRLHFPERSPEDDVALAHSGSSPRHSRTYANGVVGWRSIQHLFARFRFARALRLDHCFFGSHRIFFAVAGSLAMLEDLALATPMLQDSAPWPNALQLRSLDVRGAPPAFAQGLLPTAGPLLITRLAYLTLADDTESVGELLRRLGSVLEDFRLGVTQRMRRSVSLGPLTLHNNTSLRHLTFDDIHLDQLQTEGPIWIAHLLSSVNSSLTHLTVHLRFYHAGGVDLVDWARISAMLCSVQFSAFQQLCVVIRCIQELEPSTAEDLIRERVPELVQRGMLTIEHD